MANQEIIKTIQSFAKEIIDGIDEGRISHSIDMVDFTAEYIERLKKNVED